LVRASLSAFQVPYPAVSVKYIVAAMAVRSKGNLEPFMQQLQKFDVREINTYRDMITLSEDIAIKILKSGIMKKQSKASIKKKIGIFLDPRQGTITHSRSINCEEAAQSGLKIEVLDVHCPQWTAMYELYSRTQTFVNCRKVRGERGRSVLYCSPAGLIGSQSCRKTKRKNSPPPAKG